VESGRESLRVCSLASGSNGNCILIHTGASAMLIDAGISARAILAGMASAGVAEDTIRAIVLTHEHSDHTRGLQTIARRLGVPVIANRATLARACGAMSGISTSVLNTGDGMEIAGVRVNSFAVSHDAAEPVGYHIQFGSRRLGYATDTGIAHPEILRHLRGVDLAIIESNHDIERLQAGPYPAFLKKRILGDAGHLSNAVAADLALELLRHFAGTEVWLAHLSETNNTPDLALSTVSRCLSEAGYPVDRVSVAPRGRPGPIWQSTPRWQQLSLF
jgi:phosphoribosyl 1,2-cyclic phosphodiesterase